MCRASRILIKAFMIAALFSAEASIAAPKLEARIADENVGISFGERTESADIARPASKSRLETACAKDSIVYGYGTDGSLKRTGSEIDGYCEGYLLATYMSMIRSKTICNENPKPPSAYFLRSVLQEHLKGASSQVQEEFLIASSAFLNAFNCKRKAN